VTTVPRTRPAFWIRRSPFPQTRYHVRAWGSDYWPDLNYETTELPTKLDRRYPFIDISNVDRPAPIVIPKDTIHVQA
jgi:hypothetical protein